MTHHSYTEFKLETRNKTNFLSRAQPLPIWNLCVDYVLPHEIHIRLQSHILLFPFNAERHLGVRESFSLLNNKLTMSIEHKRITSMLFSYVKMSEGTFVMTSWTCP